MTTNPIYRIGIYIDGAFLRNVNIYFNYGPPNYGWIDYNGLQEFITEKVECLFREGSLPSIEGKNFIASVVRCSLYDGRGPEIKDKNLDKRLFDANIIAKIFPLQEKTDTRNGKTGTLFVQRGIQSELICDALSSAYQNQVDVIVLISGDQEFVPLARTLQETNKPIVLVYFDIPEWVDSNGIKHRPTSASHRLINASSFSVDVCEDLKKDERWKDCLFVD